MIYRRCGRCGKRIESGTTCPCRTQDKRIYTKAEGISKYYHTGEWHRVSTYILRKYDGVDVYAWAVHRVLLTADTVHHIVPLKENYGKRTEIDNLIPVSRKSHSEIEKLYRDGRKRETQEKLYRALREWKDMHDRI